MKSSVFAFSLFLLTILPAVVASEPLAPGGESAEVLYPAKGVSKVRISPSGRWVTASATKGRIKGVLVQRTGRAQIETVITTESRHLNSWWVGEDTMLTEFETPTGYRYLIVKMVDAGGSIRVMKSWVDAIGWLVHPLPLDEDEVLWAFDYKGNTSLHRVTLDQLREFREDRTSRGRFVLPGSELASVAGTGRGWVVDREGNPRAVVKYDHDGYTVLVREEGKSSFHAAKVIAYGEREELLEPVGVAQDGESLIVRAYHDQDTIGLYEFDPRTNKIGDLIFRRPDVDVSGVRFDFLLGELIGAVYEADGDRQFHYFKSYSDLFLGDLAESFPSERVEAVSGSLNRRFFAFKVSSSTNPGVYYLRDATLGRTFPIATEASAIDREQLSEVESFVVNSADGLEIEAFLAIPKNGELGKVPLVVMPHGGPFGVRDNKRYDFFVQYLASWGFAVLQPNFRGSAGYGLKFIEAGKKQWAERIEDDIDAAVDWAMARPEIDSTRLCIIGGSYGGFSALASVVRHKTRYRCAISWNGVSDIPLLYDSSDTADSKRAMAFYEEYVGDLETERDKLVAASPAYHVEQIETPILVLFGDEDRRVDPDHSHRMLLMLETLGKEHDVLEIKGMSHGYSRVEGIIIARAMRRYLTRYLYTESQFRADPEIRKASASDFLPTIRLDR